MTRWFKWFTFDFNNGFQIFETEKEAEEEFKKILEDYHDDAIMGEWDMQVEHVTWGRIFQEVKVVEIPHEMDEDDGSDPYPDGVWDAKIVELREEKL
jgi:hypothetical protein